jgi:hypothetical protein
MKYGYYDSLSFYRTETDYRVKVKISGVDSTSITEKTILEKVFPIYTLIFVLIIAIPFLVLIMVWMMLKNLLIKNTPPPPTYEEAKKWFEDGNGYFDNLSEQEKQEIVSKKDLPLGL